MHTFWVFSEFSLFNLPVFMYSVKFTRNTSTTYSPVKADHFIPQLTFFFIMLPRQMLKSCYKFLSVNLATLRTFFVCLFGTQIHWSVPAMDRSCALWDRNCKFTLPMTVKSYLLYFFTCVWPHTVNTWLLFAPKRDVNIPRFDESLIMNNRAWRCWSS